MTGKIIITTPNPGFILKPVNEDNCKVIKLQPNSINIEVNGLVPSPVISAYQLALNNGFEGTEQDWIESLRSTNIDFTLSYNIAKL